MSWAKKLCANAVIALFGLTAIALASCRESPLTGQARFVGGCETPEHRMSAVWAPTWSPDGQRVAFYSALDSAGVLAPGVYVLDVATHRTELVYRDPYMNTVLALQWSPIGRSLLVSRGLALYILDLDTGAMRGMTGRRPMSGGAWNWAGDSIYYTREMLHWYDPPDSMGLYVASASDGGERRFIPSDGSHPMPIGSVGVAPDGEWIAFSAQVRDSDGVALQGGEIFIIRRDGSGLRQLTHLHSVSREPKWIEGGTLIAFDSYPVECFATGVVDGHTWVVSPSGGEPRPYFVDISDRNVQFSWPPAIDRTGWRVAATVKNPQNNVGELFTMSLRSRGRWRPLFTPPIDTSRVADLSELRSRVGRR